MQPIVFGLAGPTLSEEEARFFRSADPLGFILFARNCIDKEQIKHLTTSLREVVGREDAPILIDQEGGRVARLKPPIWAAYPPAKTFGDLATTDPAAAERAARLNATLIGADLAEIGINVDCAPLADVPVPGAHQMIGDRAFSENPDIVARLARAACEGFLAANVTPVLKHLPGYGRARVDSHKALTVVDAPLDVLEASDFRPFEALADIAWGMSAHVIYTAIDPHAPATLSPTVISAIVRGRIGFAGILITDDLTMHALEGTLPGRATACLAAGCDLALHCDGNLSDMRAIADVLPQASPELVARLARAEADRKAAAKVPVAEAGELRRELASLVG